MNVDNLIEFLEEHRGVTVYLRLEDDWSVEVDSDHLGVDEDGDIIIDARR